MRRDGYPPEIMDLSCNGVVVPDDALLINLNVGNNFIFYNKYK